MTEKNSDLLKNINNFSGILTFLSVLCAIIFYFSSIQSSLSKIEDSQVRIMGNQGDSLVLISDIKESLKDKNRDHLAFASQLGAVGQTQIGIEKAIVRLDLTLTNLNSKLDRIN